jgi:hypothetical protein
MRAQPRSSENISSNLIKNGILGDLNLGEDNILSCYTELNTIQEIESFTSIITETIRSYKMRLIFEYNEEISGHVPNVDDKEKRSEGNLNGMPKDLVRKELPLPNVSEISVVRHYTDLSRKIFALDIGFYPQGS